MSQKTFYNPTYNGVKLTNQMENKFAILNDANVKDGISVGPQIRQLVSDPAFNRVRKGKKRKLGKPSRDLFTDT